MSAETNLRSLVILFTFVYSVNTLPYDVHWLGGSTTIDRDYPTSKNSVDIYCYSGTSKSLLTLWQTVKFHVKLKNNEFSQYIGSTPDEVYKDYTEDSYGWSAVISPFQRKAQKSLSLELFAPTCMAINTKQRHSIELQIIRVDIWKVVLMLFGIVLISSAKSLSGNPLFFYICGVLIGVFASFMVLVYYVSKLLPKKTLTYGILIGGWTVGVYVLQQIWDNVRTIVASYQTYVFWYTLLASFISFMVCYRIGPPRNERSKNLVMWTLQAVGVLMIFFSSEYQEAAATVIVLTLTVKYFPDWLLHRIQGFWRYRFPPRPRLLSNEQYYEQGARETKRALEELRKHCASPDCAQWRVMLKLNDSKRFASFVEGNSHLSDDEILDYESYAFSMENARKPVGHSTRDNNMEISDDDDSSDDDEIYMR